MLKLDRFGVRCLVLGATILGVGGGGSPQRGLKVLLEDLDKGLRLEIIDVNEAGEGIVVTPYFVGAVPKPGGRRKEIPVEYMLKAVKALSRRCGTVRYVIPTEIGGGNTAIAIHLGALLGLQTIDADHVGRSVPELIHSSFYLHGVPLTPSSLVDPYGDVVAIEEYASIEHYENIVRSIVTATGRAFVIDTPVTPDIVRKVAVLNSISKAYELGLKVIEAREKGRSVPDVIAEYLNGYVIMEGKIARYNLREEGGSLKGWYEIKGEGLFKGKILRIDVKNENIAAWLNGEAVTLPPDLIIVVKENGEALVNNEIAVGLRVSVVAAPAPPVWRTAKGLEILGPKHFGYNVDYEPVEKLVKKHKL